MSLELYDVAVTNKVKGVFKNSLFGSPDEIFKVVASRPENGGRVLMPFIGIWRNPDMTINRNLFSDPGLMHGRRFNIGENIEEPIKYMKSIPMQVNYMFDVYAIDRYMCDILLTKLLFNLMRYPIINIVVPESGESLDFTLLVQDNVTDNSSIGDFQDSGRYYRMTCEATIDNVLVYDVDKDLTNVVLSSPFGIMSYEGEKY